MTNQRLYTNKAMAIGAVIDAIACDLADLTDIWMMTEGRLRDKGVFGDDHPYLSDHDIDRLNDDEDSFPECINRDNEFPDYLS